MKLSQRVLAGSLAGTVALLVAGWLASPAGAAVTNDRDYRFGDSGTTDGELGANVAEGSPIGFLFSGNEIRTGDETGPESGGAPDLGGFIDLLVPGTSSTSHSGATYTDTSGRPLGESGDFGVRFDGTDDVISGIALDIPEELAGRIGSATYPFEFAGIVTRGLQMWVRPDQAGLDAAARQTIVMDTTESGGVAITADGKWTQIFDSETADDGIPATVAVAGDTWVHVMQHNYPSGSPGAPALQQGGDAGFNSVVYVDGIAVSATNDLPDPGDLNLGGRVGLLSVGAAELANQDADPETADFGEFFDGTVDDLRLYVYGDNSSAGGENYGTFDLFADNEWIANQIATTVPGGVLAVGDVNRDGVVDVAGDVPAFVAGWLSQNQLEGWGGKLLTVGDWNTWGKGDMNLDGRVDLLDWAMINAASPALGAALAEAITNVPEPNSLMLIGIAASCGMLRRRTRQV